MCRELLAGGVRGFHFYTLNLESSTARILDELGWLPPALDKPLLPYKSTVKNGTRPEETVRPIFWANRPKSYIMVWYHPPSPPFDWCNCDWCVAVCFTHSLIHSCGLLFVH
jgi:hypothetical protein